jgi:hypothetical protein
MRLAPVVLAVALAMPCVAQARGHARGVHRGKVASHAKASRGSASSVAGALREADRPAAPATAAAQPADEAPRHGPRTIDFDERAIEGQTNKSGAVYLYDRKDLAVKSMVKQPSTFRSEIAKGLLE